MDPYQKAGVAELVPVVSAEVLARQVAMAKLVVKQAVWAELVAVAAVTLAVPVVSAAELARQVAWEEREATQGGTAKKVAPEAIGVGHLPSTAPSPNVSR
jgi:hypothetical protein